MDWKKLLDEIKYKYSPTIPSVDATNKDSRRNWILLMAQKTERFPVRQIYDKCIPTVTKMTVNTDLKSLEEQGLIKREKDNKNKSYVIPLFEDSGEAPVPVYEKRKKLILNIGLPVITFVLFGIFLWINV